jgi:hypothetical protein
MLIVIVSGFQVEQRHNEILEKCSAVRDEMGTVTTNISLEGAYQTLLAGYESEMPAALPLFEDGPPPSPAVKLENGNTSTGALGPPSSTAPPLAIPQQEGCVDFSQSITIEETLNPFNADCLIIKLLTVM